MHRTGTKLVVRHMQKSVIQWSVISKFTCILTFVTITIRINIIIIIAGLDLNQFQMAMLLTLDKILFFNPVSMSCLFEKESFSSFTSLTHIS